MQVTTYEKKTILIIYFLKNNFPFLMSFNTISMRDLTRRIIFTNEYIYIFLYKIQQQSQQPQSQPQQSHQQPHSQQQTNVIGNNTSSILMPTQLMSHLHPTHHHLHSQVCAIKLLIANILVCIKKHLIYTKKNIHF